MNSTIILPTYNEAENIRPLIDALVQTLGERDYEIIVVDDNSPDGTWQIAEEAARQNPRIKVLRRMDKRGLTSALTDGIALASKEVALWMDCDFQMPPDRVPQLLQRVEDGYDMVIGSRFMPGGNDLRYEKSLKPKFHLGVNRWLSWLLSRFTSWLLCPQVTDWTSGFIAIRIPVVRRLGLVGDYGEYFLYLVFAALQHGYKVTELPYVLTYRARGTSKTATGYLDLFTKGIKYLYAVIRLSVYGA